MHERAQKLLRACKNTLQLHLDFVFFNLPARRLRREEEESIFLEEESIKYKQVQSSQKRKYTNKSLETKANKCKLEGRCKFHNDNY